MNEIMLHSGGEFLSYESLKAVPTPPATATWTPIAHFELLDGIKRQLAMGHLIITREVLAISRGALGTPADRFFGLLEIQSENESYGLTVGVRNSNDRSFPAGLCVGSKVFICSNLAFSSEVVISRKHTRFIRRDLPRLISDAVGRLGTLRDHQSRRIEAYQNTAISDPQLNDLAIRSLDAGGAGCQASCPACSQNTVSPRTRHFGLEPYGVLLMPILKHSRITTCKPCRGALRRCTACATWSAGYPDLIRSDAL